MLWGKKVPENMILVLEKTLYEPCQHWAGLCILKPENVSPSCRDIIVSMLWSQLFKRRIAINLYPLDSTIGFPNIYPLDSDLSGG